MATKKFPAMMNLKRMSEYQRLEKLKEFLHKNPNYTSLEDLALFTSLGKQEVLRLQRIIKEEEDEKRFPTKLQMREWNRLKSGKLKLIKEAWTTEDSEKVQVWVDFDGEVKSIATFHISEGLMDLDVARKGAMRYLEFFWKDENARIEKKLEPETYTLIRSLGSLNAGDIPVEPKKMAGLIDEIF
jgi:hypothetical protein